MKMDKFVKEGIIFSIIIWLLFAVILIIFVPDRQVSWACAGVGYFSGDPCSETLNLDLLIIGFFIAFVIGYKISSVKNKVSENA